MKKRNPPSTPMGLIQEISRLCHEKIKADCPEMQRSCRLIMIELAHQDNVTQLDLVRATHLKAPTVSVCLGRMEQDGLVSRTSDPTDLRAIRVSLTQKGRAIHESIWDKIRELDRRIESSLTTDEQATLVSLLEKMRNYLCEEVLCGEKD